MKKATSKRFILSFVLAMGLMLPAFAGFAAQAEDVFVVQDMQWYAKAGDSLVEAPGPNGGQETEEGWFYWIFVEPDMQDESKGLERGLLVYNEEAQTFSFLPLAEGWVNSVIFSPDGERFIIEGHGEMEMYDSSLSLYTLADMKLHFNTMKAALPPVWVDLGRFVYSRNEAGTTRGRPDDYPDEWVSLVMYDVFEGTETVLKAATEKSDFSLLDVFEDGEITVLEEYVDSVDDWADPDKSKTREFSISAPAAG